jgi:hypothetical protein
MTGVFEQMLGEMVAAPAPAKDAPRAAPSSSVASFPAWIEGQALNSARHAAALRPFRNDEFGSGLGAPSEGHIQSVNQLIKRLRRPLLKRTGRM